MLKLIDFDSSVFCICLMSVMAIFHHTDLYSLFWPCVSMCMRISFGIVGVCELVLPVCKCCLRDRSPSMDESLESPSVALLVRNPWATLLVHGEKTWELRSRRTSRRGRIAIAASGTRGLVGEVCLVDCICVGMRGPDGKLIPSDTADGRLNFLGSAANMPKHRVADLGMINYKRVWAWVMEAPLAYDQPRSYMFTGQE